MFYGVIPKEGLAGLVPAKPSFCWAGASQAFFWYDNDKDVNTGFRMTRLTVNQHLCRVFHKEVIPFASELPFMKH